MSQFYVCRACNSGWQVAGDPKEVKGITDILKGEGANFPCITPLCSGRIMLASGPPSGFVMKELPIRAFYRAVHGFGTGEGDPASMKDFAELLTNGRIVSIDASPVGQPERIILRQLVFEDGTRMHFDSSSRGACCYYIERPGKTCTEVVEDELRNTDSADQTADGLPDSNREETGRAPSSGQLAQSERGEGLRPGPASGQPRAVPVSALPAEARVSEGDRPSGGRGDLRGSDHPNLRVHPAGE